MPKDTYTRLFSNITNTPVSADLVEKIEDRINRARIFQLRLRAGLYSAGTVVAILVFIPLIQHMFTTFGQSGFSSYLSLIISDGSYVVSLWKELGISLVESLPMISVAGFIALVSIFIYSLTKSLKYFQTLKTYRHA